MRRPPSRPFRRATRGRPPGRDGCCVAVDLSWFTGLETLFTSVATGIASAAAAFFALRKKYSADTTAIVEDRTEAKLLVTLMAERDAAVKAASEAWNERLKDARELARLGALLESERAKSKQLSDLVFGLRMHMQKQDAVIMKVAPQESGLMGLGEIPGHPAGSDDGN